MQTDFTDPAILMQVRVRESASRHLKAEAARAGKTMGEMLTDLLREYAGYIEPTAGGTSAPGGPGARQSNKPIGGEGEGK